MCETFNIVIIYWLFIFKFCNCQTKNGMIFNIFKLNNVPTFHLQNKSQLNIDVSKTTSISIENPNSKWLNEKNLNRKCSIIEFKNKYVYMYMLEPGFPLHQWKLEKSPYDLYRVGTTLNSTKQTKKQYVWSPYNWKVIDYWRETYTKIYKLWYS